MAFRCATCLADTGDNFNTAREKGWTVASRVVECPKCAGRPRLTDFIIVQDAIKNSKN